MELRDLYTESGHHMNLAKPEYQNAAQRFNISIGQSKNFGGISTNYCYYMRNPILNIINTVRTQEYCLQKNVEQQTSFKTLQCKIR
jgi:hypothetical protein